MNELSGSTYAEPYAGGAGAALALLYGEHVDNLLLNDADPAIFAFWNSVLRETDGLLKLIRETPLTVQEWKRQRSIYRRPNEVTTLKLGFSAFYLNRCNRSGIIANAGLIGGTEQTGQWRMDARFNRLDLINRISRVARYSDRIEIHNMDAIEFLKKRVSGKSKGENTFVYLDPPYYEKGSQLYLSYYEPSDHADLSSYLREYARFSWVLTYDDAEQIRTLYNGLRILPFNLRYSASTSRKGNEVFISERHFKGVKDSLLSIAS